MCTYYWASEDLIWGDMTATGVTAQPSRTVAVDPSVIPLNSKIRIGDDTTIYVAEDVGGSIKGNRIDVFVSEPRNERFTTKIYLLKENNHE